MPAGDQSTTKIFISYTRKDMEIAQKLFNYLNQLENVSPWFDTVNLEPGVDWERSAREEIENCSYFLALLSKNSVFHEGFVQRELRIALEKCERMPDSQIFILPVRLDNCAIDQRLKKFNVVDLFGDFEYSGLEKIRKVIEEDQKSQIEGSIYITRQDGTKIRIHKLKQSNEHVKLLLTWETFGKGIEMLSEAIHAASGIEPNAIFGVNEAGIMIASYLSFQNRLPLGIIKTGRRDKKGKGNREIIKVDYPRYVKDGGTIAIVDSEIKSGKSNEAIYKKVWEKYKNAEIIFIVLVGVVKEEPQSVIDFGWEIDTKDIEYKPDFVAFYINEPGIEPPGKIKIR